MKVRESLKLTSGFILASFLTIGCVASFEPRVSSYDLKNPGLYTAKEVRAGVEVSVEEFASPNKSRRAFDSDLAKSGVFPLLVRFQNDSSSTYKVQLKEVKAFQNGQRLTPIYAYEAAEKGGKRDMVWNSLVNTVAMGPLAMYFGVAGMAMTANHTKGVNRKIEDHFDNVELRDTLLKPNDVAAGFVFFEIPPRLNRLNDLSLEVTTEKESYEGEGEKMTYRIPIPPVILHAENNGAE